MKPLPVPPLSQTLERTLEAVAPLVDAHELHRLRDVVDAFAAGEGPRVQAELERFAAAEERTGRSWLSEAWLEDYLVVREPLPLTTSVAIQVNWDATPEQGRGVERAADIVHRLATVHLRHLRGELDAELGFRDEPLSAEQRRYLAGGARTPRPEVDGFVAGPSDASNREIGVVWRGHLLAVPVSDASGAPVGRDRLAATLGAISRLGPASSPSVLTPSYLGSAALAPILDELLAEDGNRRTYARLVDLLFVTTLVEEQGEDAAQLKRAGVGLDRTWTYKPASYAIGLRDSFVGIHMEHSIYDAGSALSVLEAAKLVEPVDEGTGEAPTATPLVWRTTADLAERIVAGAETYRQEAAHYRCRLVRVAVAPPLTSRVSIDGLMQFTMLAAQLRTFDRIRSTYEAVDMREYQAGRTECLRPNTGEAVALAHALVDGTATPAHLRAALDAHRTGVKRAKSGGAVDRHLWGLERAARRLGLAPALFTDPAVRLLTTSVLSTTSLGRRDLVLRIAFPPVVPDGLGIYYVNDVDAFEFLVNWRDDELDRVDAFEDALDEFAPLVWALADALGSTSDIR
ncbi:choline/carnitine O-acyltransferase [Pseudoclavibacter chungangensis]|uniref:Choline/carnitine O-acyltransferase n=1 Tax=Pseudoclavibacter chungangensis TaxID=587635 RepID=A0A7J5BNU7_9MICO|nr:choline/carnitine O-acyltransferase [Pseudoclavibacter chungangensis]KAB1654065.1 choline/carnitine O-acyltransferase [Pseudoclavibacter chungangensis]NYJ66024.1 carnitine O-acetyltransferase [Pseudoclavibacter chungangensis]